ncbi:MAG TPA: ROK family protein [Candidatus Limnocylindria bacterium]|nr:ROK family protein [Candidatus Limnocylindria bacterium]
MVERADRSVLAIDLGGTQIRAAHVAPDLAVASRRAVPTHDEEGVDAVVARICDLADEVRRDARSAGLDEPVGIGISSPGPLDPWRGVVVAPPNLAGWRDVPLADAVEAALGLRTFLERDTNVAVMAEWRHGAARGARNAIYVTVSTGIGGGVVVDGRPLSGPDGTAGEVGHMTVDLDGPLCGDGMPGHAEAIGSGTAIAREARRLLDAGRAPGLAALVGTGEEPDAELVARAADAGDPDAKGLLDRAWEAIGAMCASLVNVLNPEVIVIGGSIAAHRSRLWDVVRLELERRAFPVPARRVRLERPRFGADVSLVGALPIVNERLGDPAFQRAPAGAPTAQRRRST